MAVSKPASKAAGKPSPDVVEQKVVALAEQLGWFMGTVQAKADGWLDRENLRKEVGRIRDVATDLLQHVDAASRAAMIAAGKPKAGAKPAAAAKSAAAVNPRESRGPVDAPGKRHRKPPPQEVVAKHLGEPVGKRMGQKSFKVGKGRGRG